MEQQIFADAIGRISVVGGVVRLDLVTYAPGEADANGQARAVFSQRIVMGMDGFLRSSEKIIEAVQLITRAAPAQNAPAPQPAPQPAAPPPQPAAPAAVTTAPPAPPPPRRFFP